MRTKTPFPHLFSTSCLQVAQGNGEGESSVQNASFLLFFHRQSLLFLLQSTLIQSGARQSDSLQAFHGLQPSSGHIHLHHALLHRFTSHWCSLVLNGNKLHQSSPSSVSFAYDSNWLVLLSQSMSFYLHCIFSPLCPDEKGESNCVILSCW